MHDGGVLDHDQLLAWCRDVHDPRIELFGERGSLNYTVGFTGVTNGFVVSMATQTVKFTSSLLV